MGILAKKGWLVYVLFTLFVFSVYLPVVFYNLTYADDHVLVLKNHEFNKSFSNVSGAFSEDIYRNPSGAGTYYRPLLRISFMLDARFGEKNLIMISHISNIVLHILAVFLLYRMLIAFGLNKGFSFVSSLFFSVHPITTHTVAWIPGRNDSLLAIFVLLSIIFFLKYVKKQKIKYYMLHIATFVLALLTKETAVVLPAICFAYLLLFIDKDTILKKWREYVYILVVYLEILLAWFAVRYAVLGNFAGEEKLDHLQSIYVGLSWFIPAIGKILFPFSLTSVFINENIYWFIGSLLMSATAVALLKCKINLKLFIFGLCWFLSLTMVTMTQYIQSMPGISENRLYMPMIGFVFMIVAFKDTTLFAFSQERNKVTLAFGLLAVILISLCVITFIRKNDYSDNISFWENASNVAKDSSFHNANLGIAYYRAQNYRKAKDVLLLSVNLNPKERFAYNALGLVYLREGNYKKAEINFKKEIEHNPMFNDPYIHLGNMYYKNGDWVSAQKYWKRTNYLGTYQKNSFAF